MHKKIARWFKKFLKWFADNNSLILAIATVALAIITYGYLKETSLIRKTTEKSFKLDIEPKVFLAEITPIPRLNESKKTIEVTLVLKIKNAGKTEAKEVIVDYKIAYEEGDEQKRKTATVDGTIGPIQYLFTGQEYVKETKILNVKLNEHDLAIVKEAMQQKKPVIITKDAYPPLSCELKLSYLDQEEEKISYLYKYKYIFHENKLVYEN